MDTAVEEAMTTIKIYSAEHKLPEVLAAMIFAAGVHFSERHTTAKGENKIERKYDLSELLQELQKLPRDSNGE